MPPCKCAKRWALTWWPPPAVPRSAPSSVRPAWRPLSVAVTSHLWMLSAAAQQVLLLLQTLLTLHLRRQCHQSLGGNVTHNVTFRLLRHRCRAADCSSLRVGGRQSPRSANSFCATTKARMHLKTADSCRTTSFTLHTMPNACHVILHRPCRPGMQLAAGTPYCRYCMTL